MTKKRTLRRENKRFRAALEHIKDRGQRGDCGHDLAALARFALKREDYDECAAAPHQH